MPPLVGSPLKGAVRAAPRVDSLETRRYHPRVPSDLHAKLVVVSARLAATRQTLQRLGEQTATLREEVTRLRDEVEGDEAGPHAAPAGREWETRVPTRPMGQAVEDGPTADDRPVEQTSGPRSSSADRARREP